jgi:hypothetical protein
MLQLLVLAFLQRKIYDVDQIGTMSMHDNTIDSLDENHLEPKIPLCPPPLLHNAGRLHPHRRV